MVATKRSCNRSLVRKNDFVVGVRREESLEEGDGGIKDDRALDSSLDTGLDLVVVDQIGSDAVDVTGRRRVEIGRAERGAKAMRLGLWRAIGKIKERTAGQTGRDTDHAERSGLCVRASVRLRVLVVAVAIAVASDDNYTEDLRQQHRSVLGDEREVKEEVRMGTDCCLFRLLIRTKAMPVSA